MTPKTTPLHIDFLSGKLFYRSKNASLRNELLARAIGLKPGSHPFIVDATAGLGRDSFILAALGFKVTMLERSPILFSLLQDALERAKKSPAAAAIIARLELHHADAIAWLSNIKSSGSKRPDVIYMDPMFPERQKSAAVKKEMVLLQNLVGTDPDSGELFEVALTCAAKRVVVKRPRLAPNIAARAPDFSMAGKSSRFDIYLV